MEKFPFLRLLLLLLSVSSCFIAAAAVPSPACTDTVGKVYVGEPQDSVEYLKEVTVIARRTRHQADGYTVNLRSSDIVRDKSTSEALVFLPGVSRQASVYRINGVDVSEIYVDGMKLTSFSELDNIPAERIDKIKVNYLAGVSQNASVSGGTIADV